MTPIQTFGQSAPPSNLQFPTAAYLQAAQSAADTRMRGMSALGAGLASGIKEATSYFEQNKNEQARFNATKKLFDAFEGYLPEDSKSKVKDLFSDTSMSVREKNQLAPLLLSMLSQAQQQQGRERVANIMAENRLDVAAAKNPPRPERPAFSIAPTVDPLDLPAGASPAVPYMLQRPQGQPQPTQGSLSNMPKTKQNPQTGKIQFWSPEAKRYVDEPEENLFFNPKTLGLEP